MDNRPPQQPSNYNWKTVVAAIFVALVLFYFVARGMNSM
jgi:hypothetical protein